MREVSGYGFYRLQRGRCPRCNGEMFQPGPRGGSAQNVECVGCGERYNVTIVGKSLLFAQAIGHRGTGSDWTAYKEKFSPRALFEKGQ